VATRGPGHPRSVELGTALSAGWASGISMYGVAALLGIAGRLGWTDSPGWLEHPLVIGLALVLFAVELVVDKIAVLDSGWDAVHTVLRPIAGAALASGADHVDLSPAALAAAGAALAFSAHGAKAATRLLVNASPEPFSNVIVSLGEDGLVATLMALALAAPEVALAITVVLAVASTVLAIVLVRSVRRVWRGIRVRGLDRGLGRGRRHAPSSGSPSASSAAATSGQQTTRSIWRG
jgi:hypothetical protein